MKITHKEPKHKSKMTLTLEDDSTIILKPIIMIEYDGKEYISLTPEGEENEDVYFYEFIEQKEKENEIELHNIEDNYILNVILDEFDKWFDEQLKLEGVN